MLKTKTQTELKELKALLKFILPKGKAELMIFASFMIFYLAYSQHLVFHTFILDFPEFWHMAYQMTLHLYDGYFSFDNVGYYHKGYQNLIGHPLIIIYYKPLMIIGGLLIDIFHTEKAKTFFLVICMSGLISMSVVYIHRYLQSVIKIEGLMVWILTIFYGMFSTNLILVFTFESFNSTVFLLTLMVCFWGIYMVKGKDFGISSTVFFSLGLGGITVTNFVKGIIPIFFIWDNIKKKVITSIILGGILGLVILLNTVFFDNFDLVKDLKHSIRLFAMGDKFSDSSVDRIIDSFFGSPMFMPGFILGEYGWNDGKWHAILKADVYRHWWQYAFVIPLLGLLCLSVIANWKNKLVWMLLLLFGVDIFIHLIAQYGASEGFFIYGGHWVYIVPLLLGWLYKSLNNKMQQRMYIGVMSVLLVMLATNNLVMLKEFIDFASEYFATNEWNIMETASPQ